MTKKNQGVKLAIKQAGVGGVSQKELKNISKTTGANSQTVIRRMDQVNQRLKSKELAQIGLNSGAANMLIKQNEKNPVGMFSQGKGYGTGGIGKTLTEMMGTRDIAGTPIKGQMMGGRKGEKSQLMIGGTQIRGGGRVAVKGFGKQYQLPSGLTEQEAAPATQSSTSFPEEPMTPFVPEEVPVEDKVTGPGMLTGGGAGTAGASGLRRSKSRLRKLGIYGKGTSLLGRGLQYGNTLNA